MRRIIFFISFVAIIGVASSSTNAETPGVTQSYTADSSVLAGMLVELKSGTSVTPLSTNHLNHMLGVVVPINAAQLTLTQANPNSQQVLVAASGRFNVLVTNQGGSIKSGDYITISSASGLGMKAGSLQNEVVGQSLGNFDGHNAIGSLTLKSSTGKNVTEEIASIPVNVKLASNPLFKPQSNGVPAVLTKVANSVANKHVSTAQIYLSGVVLVAAVLISGVILYGGVRSGVIAIGRNPLAKGAITRGLLRVVITSLIMLSVSVVISYLILKF